MSTDGWLPIDGAVAERWTTLERDWQSVLIGAAIVALVALLELQIPW